MLQSVENASKQSAKDQHGGDWPGDGDMGQCRGVGGETLRERGESISWEDVPRLSFRTNP